MNHLPFEFSLCYCFDAIAKNMKYIARIYLIASIFGIVPIYNFKAKQSKFAFLHRAVAFSFLVFFAGCVLLVISKSDYSNTHRVMLTCKYICIFLKIFAVELILTSSLARRNKWVEFLHTFEEIDSNMNFTGYNNRFHIKIELVLGYFVLIGVFLIDIIKFVVISNENIKYSNVLYLRAMHYFLVVSILLICTFATSIKNRYVHFNRLLVSSFFVNKNNTGNAVALLVEDFARLWIKLKKLVELFDDLFGFIILSLLGFLIFILLYFINFCIICSIGGGKKIDFRLEIYMTMYLAFIFLMLVSKHFFF